MHLNSKICFPLYFWLLSIYIEVARHNNIIEAYLIYQDFCYWDIIILQEHVGMDHVLSYCNIAIK